MPAAAPTLHPPLVAELSTLGQQLRLRRKALRISAVDAAEAAGMSRATLHRIESGEPSVTMGAYVSAMHALGLALVLDLAGNAKHEAVSDRPDVAALPMHIALAEYPELKRLAWQRHPTDALTPEEALSLYERNWRHVDLQAMPAHERELVDRLRDQLGGGRLLV